MQKLTTRRETSHAAVIVPLKDKLQQMYTARGAMISNMSGHPSAMHSIGRLQRSIDLTDFSTLLTSLLRLQNIAYVTAEVISSMDGTKVDRYQINRVEIIAYVKTVTTTLKTFTASDDDYDLIANLITSFEANNQAWILQGGDDDDNLHKKIYALYKEVLIDKAGADLPVYAPHDDTIKKMSELPQIAAIYKGKGKRSAALELSAEQEEELDGLYTMYRFSATRLLDHVYQLLLDKDVWYHFVNPRTKTDVQTNLERAKTLRSLSLYCQSLLTYNQFFSLEMFLKSYDLVQEWIVRFPKIEDSTTNMLESMVRRHDMLNARADVETLINSFSAAAKADLDAIVFPSEFLGKFGLTKAISSLSKEAAKYSFAGNLCDLKDLEDKKYLPLISGVAASSLNVAYDLSQTILIGKIISNEINKAVTGLVPSITRGAARSVIDDFRSLNIHCSIPFTAPHSASWEITAGARKMVDKGVLYLDSAAPSFSFDYHLFVRENLRMVMITDRQMADRYPRFFASQIPDRDKAAKLRDTIAFSWSTLVPSTWKTADRSFDADFFRTNADNVRYLLSSISGQTYQIIIKELSLPFMQEIWATFISSFGLLYVNQNDTKPLNEIVALNKNNQLQISPSEFNLVAGHGQPYGTSYNNLEALQGPLTAETRFVALGEGLYIRFLVKIPIITDNLHVDDIPFYSQQPLMYFTSNSKFETIPGWVFDDGLLNFCLIPIPTKASVPEIKFTPKFVYITQNLFLNMNLNFQPAGPEPSREAIPLGIKTSDWPFDRAQYFLEYKNFGPYSSPATDIKLADDKQTVKDAMDEIEKAIKTDVKEAAASVEEAGVAADKIGKKAAKVIGDELSKTSGKGDADENDITI